MQLGSWSAASHSLDLCRIMRHVLYLRHFRSSATINTIVTIILVRRSLEGVSPWRCLLTLEVETLRSRSVRAVGISFVIIPCLVY